MALHLVCSLAHITKSYAVNPVFLSLVVLSGIRRRSVKQLMRPLWLKMPQIDIYHAGRCRCVRALPVWSGFLQHRSGWEKGVVEKNMHNSRRRIWLEAQSRWFGSFAELITWLGERCKSLWVPWCESSRF